MTLLRELGFDAIDDVLLYPTPEELYQHVRRSGGRAGEQDGALKERCRRAHYLASKVECAGRDLVSLNDPMARAMRHYDPSAARAALGRADQRYVRPDSIQSTLSPASYLKYIYDLANTHIDNGSSPFALDKRRPDLRELILSEDNLTQEISTLGVVNEVLEALLKDKKVATTPAALRHKLESSVHPFALPFEQEHATVREALAAMGSSLNAIERRSRPDGFALMDVTYSVVPNPGGRLRLYDKHLELLRSSPSQTELYGTWYGGSDAAALTDADTFCAKTGLSFDELLALLGMDCDVVDVYGTSSGGPVGFLSGGSQVGLQRDANRRWIIDIVGPPARVHEFHNKCIRLSRRTGLPFHALDWLLTCAMHSRPNGTHNSVLEDGTALNVLAHFLEYRDALGLDVDQFGALIWRASTIHRVGSAEPSLLQRLFGSRAADVQDKLYALSLKVGDLDPTRGLTEMGEIIRGGLAVTSAEWLAIVHVVAPDPNTIFDAVVLARLYRVVTVLRSVGFGVLPGLALAQTVDAALLETLGRSDDCEAVLSAIDRLIWLSGWMKESAFEPLSLLAVAAPWDASHMYPNQDTLNWVIELQQAIQPALLSSSTLRAYLVWDSASGDSIFIDEKLFLGAIKVFFWDGLVRQKAPGDGGTFVLTTVLASFLKQQGVELAIETNRQRFLELCAIFTEKETAQAEVLAAQVIKHSDTLSEAVVPPVLEWMGYETFEVLKTLVNWKTRLRPADVEGMSLLLSLRRHLQVVSHLGMDEPEIEMVTHHPDWLAVGMETPLSLRQVYLLWCLKRLQNAKVSANDWLAYFKRVRSPKPQGSGEMLARLLDFPEGDVAKLAVAPSLGIADGVVNTVEQVDFIARRIALCRDGSFGAGELDALTPVMGRVPNWGAAAEAALAGLKRREGGAYVAAAEGRIGEERRDALTAVTLTEVMAGEQPPGLLAQITDEERLYEYLLLDVKVSAAVPTTRLLEATGSVQLYINQVLENVEKPQKIAREELRAAWEVGQQYRVWEANESLKLYPSNYIEPELRRGKSELFRQFEQAVTQVTEGDMNDDVVRGALIAYVAGLQKLTELRPQGFFCSRDASPMTYFFTARAQHEQYGYYIRRLDVDMDRLSRGEAMHALSWGDWQKAAMPISAQYVYCMAPAFAWNRLFLLWFELEKVTRTSKDGKPVDSYYLRPKYSRQNLDGTFTEAQIVKDVELDVTSDILVEKVTSPSGEVSEELRPEKYKGPTMYQPCYMPGTDSLLAWFKVPGQRGATSDRSFCWTVTPNTSTVRLEETIDMPGSGHTLTDYTSVPHALQLVRRETLWIQPTSYGPKLALALTHSTPRNHLSIGGYFCLELQADPERKDCVNVITPEQEVTCCATACDIASGNYYRLKSVQLSAGAPPGHEQGYTFMQTPMSIGTVNTKVPLPSTTLSVTLPAGVAYGSIKATLKFECEAHTFSSVYDFTLEKSFESDYSLGDKYVSHLYRGKDEDARPGEYYLLTEVSGGGTLVFALGSNAMREVAVEAGSLFDMLALLRNENQRGAERGVRDFLEQAEKEYGEISEPKPKDVLDFDGPFGLYAWELFYHIPSIVAARYRNIGKFDVARKWLNAIYDPNADESQVWRCEPLQPTDARSLSIADPDRLATENPGHYRLATTRQYLRTMTEQGDAYYRQETAETLRQAKMWYVSAQRLFTEEVGDALQQATRTEWTNPTLGAVQSSDFRPPYNEDLKSDYTTLEARLDNLRNWRSFDGEPLQIALLAPKLDPRELQLAAMSGMAATTAGSKSAQTSLPFTFPEALAKAKEAVRNLMYFGDLLTKGLHRRDEQVLAEMQATLAHHVAANFERDGQMSLIESMKMEIKILEKSQDEAQKSLDWYEFFAGELFNGCEIAAFPLWVSQAGALVGAMTFQGIEKAADLMPNIYGLAMGGSDWGAIPESMKYALERAADMFGTLADTQTFSGEAIRRQQENKMERDVAKLAVERIKLEVARLKYDLSQEEGTLEVLEEKARRTEAIVDFHARRATNKDFHNWYVGRMTSLYNAAYDMALRFCRVAERAYQVDDPTGRFINPVWEAQYKGLLSGQGLMLDLQRMDYAYMHRRGATNQGKLKVSLAALDPQALVALRHTGQAMFSLRDELFDEQFPDEHERRIKSVRVRLIGLEGRDDIAGRLALIADRVHFDRRRSHDQGETHVLGRQQITMTSHDTDTSQLPVPEGRLSPFERCGVESTWILSIPGAVRAIKARQKTFRQQDLLAQLEDVALEVTYTARA